MKIGFLGIAGFPYGRAQIQRQLLMARSLSEVGCHVTVVCRKGVHNKNVSVEAHGQISGIEYIYTSGSPFRESNFLKRNINKLKGVFGEIYLLSKSNFDLVILDCKSFLLLFYYWLLSKFLGFKIVYSYVEFYSSMQDRKKSLYRVNDFFLENSLKIFVNSAIPISGFLNTELQKKNINTFIIPPLVDFNLFHNENSKVGNYFLFCGGAGYFEVIKFIIDSFDKLDYSQTELVLVVGGLQTNIKKINGYIQNIRSGSRIKILNNLEYSDLLQLYQNALGLLVPLRPTLQDIARFPHKFGEYCASKRPIVTTHIGEVKKYFIDGENALIAESYDVDLFASKMKFILENEQKASEIGLEGFFLGKKVFDYTAYSDALLKWFEKIL